MAVLVDGKPLEVKGDVMDCGLTHAHYVKTSAGYNVEESYYENGIKKIRKYAHIISK